MCQQGRWALKVVNLVGVPYRLEKGMSVSEDGGSQSGVDFKIPHWLGRRTKHFFIRVWKFLPSIPILKTFKGKSKETISISS